MATLTARENEVLILSFQCFKSDPQVNYNSLAELAGLKNAASATTAYLTAKKKLLAKGNLTAREREIIAMAWKCFNTPPKVDYAKLAGLASLKNAASATTAFLTAKKKLLQGSDEATTPKKRKSLPTDRKSAESPEAAAESSTTPAKKKRKRANTVTEPSSKSAAILAAVDSEEDEEEEEEEVKPVNKAKKGKKARSETVKSEPEDEVDAALFETAREYLKQEEVDE